MQSTHFTPWTAWFSRFCHATAFDTSFSIVTVPVPTQHSSLDHLRQPPSRLVEPHCGDGRHNRRRDTKPWTSNNDEKAIRSSLAPYQRQKRKLEYAPRNSSILKRNKIPTSNRSNSGDCGCVSGGGIHFFGQSGQSAGPQKSHSLDNHKDQTQTWPFKYQDR